MKIVAGLMRKARALSVTSGELNDRDPSQIQTDSNLGRTA